MRKKKGITNKEFQKMMQDFQASYKEIDAFFKAQQRIRPQDFDQKAQDWIHKVITEIFLKYLNKQHKFDLRELLPENMDTSFTGTEFTQDADASGFIDNSRSASRVRGFSSFGLDFDDKPVNFIDQVAKENDETNKIEQKGVKKQSAIPIDGYPSTQRDFTQLNSIISHGKPTQSAISLVPTQVEDRSAFEQIDSNDRNDAEIELEEGDDENLVRKQTKRAVAQSGLGFVKRTKTVEMNLSAGEYEVDATKFMNHVNEVPIIHDEDRPAPNVDMLTEIVMYSGGVCQLDGKKKKKGSSAPNTQEMIKINGQTDRVCRQDTRRKALQSQLSTASTEVETQEINLDLNVKQKVRSGQFLKIFNDKIVERDEEPEINLDIVKELCCLTNGHAQLNAYDEDLDRERQPRSNTQALLMGGIIYTKQQHYELDMDTDEAGMQNILKDCTEMILADDDHLEKYQASFNEEITLQMAAHQNGHDPIFIDIEGDHSRAVKSKDGLYATTVTKVEEPVEVQLCQDHEHYEEQDHHEHEEVEEHEEEDERIEEHQQHLQSENILANNDEEQKQAIIFVESEHEDDHDHEETEEQEGPQPYDFDDDIQQDLDSGSIIIQGQITFLEYHFQPDDSQQHLAIQGNQHWVQLANNSMRVYKNRAQASLNIHAPLFGIPIKSIKKINRQGFASLHLAKNEIENLRTYIGSCVFELQYAEEYIEYRIHHGEWLPNARNLLALYDGTLEESDIESEDDWLQINQYRLLLACKDKASLQKWCKQIGEVAQIPKTVSIQEENNQERQS